MRCTTVLPVVAAVLIMGAPVAAGAQTVRGTLVEHPHGAPLPHGSVTLLDSAGTVVDSTRATADGTFTLHAHAAGVYLLYFAHPGYAGVPSGSIRVGAGQTVEHRFEVPLISGVAIERMSQVIDVEKRLQSNLPELCGEELRPTAAGLVVGVVRTRPGGRPLAGAIVRLEALARDGGERFHRATVTSANGVYVICNVPSGTVTSRTQLIGYRTDEGPIDVRAGEIGWYDVYLRAW